MTHTCAKGQSQRSFGSKVKSGNKRTDGWTDGGDCIISHANAVSNEGSLAHADMGVEYTVHQPWTMTQDMNYKCTCCVYRYEFL